ncbi:RSVR protein, partial [Odontophorus gujanensis]|nr:RSVR protein [Odontophorus gujanensis]
PEQFRCSEPYDPQTDCYPLEWLCDGHPDCSDEWDERGCGTSESPATPTAYGTGTARPPAGAGGDMLARCSGWFSAYVLFSLVLLSCLMAVGGIAAWGKSKAKSKSDIFSLKYASRVQLVPDKSQ